MNLQTAILIMQAAEKAIEFICKAESTTPEEALARWIFHNTAGKPNDPALGDH